MNDSTELNKGVELKENNEENIMDLTEIVEKGPDFINKIPDKQSYPNEEIDNDDIIKLNSIVEDDSDKHDIEDIDILNMSLDLPGTEIEELSPSESESKKLDNNVSVNHPELTDQQVETALEKIIKKNFSQKIETMIFQIVEKVVAKEIADIKASMAE